MDSTALFLSHWDASIHIFISGNVVADLKNHHIIGVRFLYDCYRRTQQGAILNHDNDMNFPIQISAFVSALKRFITIEAPALIVCSQDSLKLWHYYLEKYSGHKVTVLSDNNYDSDHLVILATIEDAKLLREIKHLKFFVVVIDELDKVVIKMIVKQLKGQFHIGLTTRNFLKHPDQKLFWLMMNWANPGVLGKFPEFCIEDAEHLLNFRYPYGTWWQRLTWQFCDSFKKPTALETEQLNQIKNSNSISAVQKQPTKRKRSVKTKPNSKEDKIVFKMQNVRKETSHKFSKDNSADLNQTTETIVEEELDLNHNDAENLNSSQETIICSPTVQDDNSILFSIMGSSNQATLSRPFHDDVDVKEEKRTLSEVLTAERDALSMLFDEPKIETDDNDILTCIMDNRINTQSVENQNFENDEIPISDNSSKDVLSLFF